MARNQAKIDRMKGRLQGGNLSQADAEALASKIRAEGGKVQLAKYGYTGGVKTAAPAAPSQPAAPTTPATGGPVLPDADPFADISKEKTATKLEDEAAVEDFQTDKTIGLQNPDQYNPYGSQEVTRNPDGSLKVETKFSEDQQKTSDLDTEISQGGRVIATGMLSNPAYQSSFDPTLTDREFSGDLVGDRARMEDAVFQRLTRNTNADYKREKSEMEDMLYSKGIPIDPRDPRYQAAMDNLNRRYDGIKADARGQAVQMGGDEYSRSFGIGEDLRANELSEQSQIRGQGISEIGQFSSLGTGLQAPQFQAYQGTQYDMSNPSDLYYKDKEVALRKKEVDAAVKKLNTPPQQPQQPAAPAAPNPFNNSLPPGL